MAERAGKLVNHAALEFPLRSESRRLQLHGGHPLSGLLIQSYQKVARCREFWLLFQGDFEALDGVRILANPMVRQS